MRGNEQTEIIVFKYSSQLYYISLFVGKTASENLKKKNVWSSQEDHKIQHWREMSTSRQTSWEKNNTQKRKQTKKHGRTIKRRNSGVGGLVVGAGADKSLNLSLSLALFVLCWFWPQVDCRSPRKLPVSIQPYKLPHAPQVPVKMVTPIKTHSLVMNWKRS